MRTAKGQRARKTAHLRHPHRLGHRRRRRVLLPGCGGDRNYRRRTGRRRLTVLGLPLLARGERRTRRRVRRLPGRTSRPTPSTTPPPPASRRCCGTPCTPSRSPCSPRAAPPPVRSWRPRSATVRDAGLDDCTEEQLLHHRRGARRRHRAPATAPTRRPTPAAPPSPSSSTRSLEPLAPHLAAAGREAILLQGARIALADGPYSQAEREVLTTVGGALQLLPRRTRRRCWGRGPHALRRAPRSLLAAPWRRPPRCARQWRA